MGETVVLFVVFLLVISLRVQVRSQEELSKEGILCITQNQEKSALGRWLYCLEASSSINTKDAEADPLQIIEESATEQFIEHKEVEQLIEYKDVIEAENIFFGDGEGSKGILSLRSESVDDDGLIEITRVSDEDALLSWLKLNLAALALSRLLFGLVKKCSRRISYKDTSELRMMNMSEDYMKNVSEISKSVIVDDTTSKNHSGTANLNMLGSSLGSVVGAVFSEVLSKSCSSGSPVPTDKICAILECALKDLSSLVHEDDCCSRLVLDFITSFKTTYSTMYRIHQACASHGGHRLTDSNFKEDKSFANSNRENDCISAKSCVEVSHTQGMDIEDEAWRVKEELPHQDASTKSREEETKSRNVQAMDASSDLPKCSRPLAPPGELDTGAPGTSTFDDYGLEPNMESAMRPMKMESRNILSYVGGDNALEETMICASAELTDKLVMHMDYEVDDASSVCEEPPSIMPSNVLGRLNTSPLVDQTYSSGPSEFQKVFLKFYERHVQAQEQHNHYKYIKLRHLEKQQNLDEEKIQLAAAANGLMRENIHLGRSKASFKKSTILEQQAKAAHMSFCSTCADELAAGLCVMLTTLVYSVRMYSIALLNDLVSMCQPAMKEPRRSAGFHIDWFYNFLDTLAGKLQAVVCHFTVTGRIVVGSLIVGIVTHSLLRRSVTNSSQAMPATILIIVLGGVCGFVGKVSVDSLGGSGTRWWVVWGMFCLLHALINCFTPTVYRLLHGSSTRPKSRFGPPFWIRRLAFHSTLVLVLPLLAGLLPFGTLSCVMNDLFVTLVQCLGGIYASVCELAVFTFYK